MRPEKKKLQIEEVTLEIVKSSVYGCRNCLWNSCECSQASKFAPAIAFDGKPTCKAYAYYD